MSKSNRPKGRVSSAGGKDWARAVTAAALILALSVVGARAETIGGALIKAYLNNPDINTQRAATRAADEAVPKAAAEGLPQISGEADAGVQGTQVNVPSTTTDSIFGPTTTPGVVEKLGQKPRGYGITINQSIYNGNRVSNGIAAAESQVLGQREQLRNTVQNVLLQALTAYMDVMRDTAILDLNKNNVEVLKEQLRQTQDRFNVGELTRTDVAQAQASLATAEGQELQAVSQLETSIASYRQRIGDEPAKLAPVAPIVKPIPKTVNEAVAISQVEHPAIVAALHGVDAALLQIKISEGALLPTVGLQASVNQRFDVVGQTPTGIRELDGSLVGQINIPLWDGGATYAGIRAAKETLGQQELSADSVRDQVRQAVAASWGANQASVGVVKADKASVAANEVALAGVREEAKDGQRTTLDVLNAQLAVLQSRVQLVRDEHDQVVNSYQLLSAIGRLSVSSLGLSVVEYDPRTHFDQVKSRGFGAQTPDGK